MSIEDRGNRIVAYLPSTDHPDGYRVWCVAHQWINGLWLVQWRPRAKDRMPRQMTVANRRSAIDVIRHSFPGRWRVKVGAVQVPTQNAASSRRGAEPPVPIRHPRHAHVPRPRRVA